MLHFLLSQLQLSFIVRIVPSPDWFVGVDSINLCDGDQWKENVSLVLFPYDAGTDSGFTFSSPNFETIPQEKVTQVGKLKSLWKHKAKKKKKIPKSKQQSVIVPSPTPSPVSQAL